MSPGPSAAYPAPRAARVLTLRNPNGYRTARQHAACLPALCQAFPSATPYAAAPATRLAAAFGNTVRRRWSGVQPPKAAAPRCLRIAGGCSRTELRCRFGTGRTRGSRGGRAGANEPQPRATVALDESVFLGDIVAPIMWGTCNLQSSASARRCMIAGVAMSAFRRPSPIRPGLRSAVAACERPAGSVRRPLEWRSQSETVSCRTRTIRWRGAPSRSSC